MVSYIDVHAHLESDKFSEDLDGVISRCKDENVLVIQSGVNPETNRESLELSKKYGIMCSFGIYPIDGIAIEFDNLKDDYEREIPKFNVDDELEWIEEHSDDCVLIGEVGLDFKVVECSSEMKEAQIRNFEKIIELAKKIDKPILIHSRGAELECVEILEKHRCEKVIMHCFSGRKVLIKRARDNGWFLSVPPIITRLQHFETLVGIVPLKQILTETDAPYLSPVVGERNEPVNVKVSVREIARIKEVSEDEVRNQVYENAKGLFKI